MKYLAFAILALTLLVVSTQSVEATRLWSSGFELATTTDEVELDITDTASAMNLYISTSTKRSGYASLCLYTTSTASNPSAWQVVRAETTTPMYWSAWFYASTTPASTTTFFFASQGFPNSGLKMDNNTIGLFDEDAFGGFGATTTFATGTWNKVDYFFDFTRAGAADIMRARLNGIEFASATDRDISVGVAVLALGVDNLGPPAGPVNGGMDICFDDVMVNSTDTKQYDTTNNSWTGNGHIVHMMPNASGALPINGNASSSPLCGQWDCVNERTPNSEDNYWVILANNGQYNVNIEDPTSSVVGIEDNSATNSTTIQLVQVGIRERPLTAAADGWKVRITASSSAGAYVHSSTAAITHNDTTWRTNGDTLLRNYPVTADVNPQTGAKWLLSELNNMRIGAECTDATPDCLFSTFWALVEYTTSSIGEAAPETPVLPTPTSTRTLFKGGSSIIRGTTIFR